MKKPTTKQKTTKAQKLGKRAKTAVLPKNDAPGLGVEAGNKTETVSEQGGNVTKSPTIDNLKAIYEEKLSVLKPKRAMFVREYLIDRDATKAIIRCGYSEAGAKVQACRLLTNANVREAVSAGQAVISEENKDRYEEAMEELRILAFSDIKNHVDVDELTGAIRCKGFEDMPDNSSKAIESVSEDRVIKETADGSQIIINDKRKFKLHNKVTALVAYIDRLKPQTQKINMTVNGAMTFFPPEPKTMAEYEALVKGGKV